MKAAKEDISIEALLTWAYREVAIDFRAADGRFDAPGFMFMKSSWELVADFAALGTLVDTSRRNVGLDVDGLPPADAVIVDRAVMALDAEATVMLILNARAGTRPGLWAREAPRIEPDLKADGTPRHIMHNRHQLACLIRWSHSPDAWELEKQHYRVWRAALDFLADELGDKLEAHRVFRSTASWAPWDEPRLVEKNVA